MAVFFLAEIEAIHDPVMYADYVRKAEPIICQYGGQYVVRSDRLTGVSGDWKAKKIVMIRFDSPQTLQACFQSPQYREIAPLREQSTTSKAVILEA